MTAERKFEGNVHQQVTQRLQQVQASAQRAAEEVKGEIADELGEVEDRNLQRVHVDIGSLAVEQHRIAAIESLHRTTPGGD